MKIKKNVITEGLLVWIEDLNYGYVINSNDVDVLREKFLRSTAVPWAKAFDEEKKVCKLDVGEEFLEFLYTNFSPLCGTFYPFLLNAKILSSVEDYADEVAQYRLTEISQCVFSDAEGKKIKGSETLMNSF